MARFAAFLSRCEVVATSWLNGRSHHRIWLAGAILTVLGIKLLLIAYAGSAVPYWDQWDGEADHLIDPYIRGTLTFADLTAAHAEHRIFFTRLITLALVELGGGWNPLFEMTVNAGIHVLVIVLFIYLLRPFVKGRAAVAAAMALVLLFGMPFAYENTLSGFQSQFYLLAGSATVAIAVLTTRSTLGPGWLAGLLLAALSIGNMASAALTPIVVIAVVTAQMLLGVRQRSLREFTGLVALLILSLAMFAAVPKVPEHEVYHAHSIVRFALAFLVSAGWPVIVPPFGFLIVQGPLLLLALRQAIRTPTFDSASWRLFALGAWTGAQFVSLAYSRAASPLQSRYIDFIAFSVLINLLALVMLVRETGFLNRPLSSRPALICALWSGTITACLMINAGWWSADGLAKSVGARAVQQANLTRFIVTGDRTALDQPFLAIPYPDADRLAAIVSRPIIRGMMPSELGATEAERETVRSRLLLRGGARLTSKQIRVFDRIAGTLFLAMGVGLWALLAGWAVFRRGKDLVGTIPAQGVVLCSSEL